MPFLVRSTAKNGDMHFPQHHFALPHHNSAGGDVSVLSRPLTSCEERFTPWQLIVSTLTGMYAVRHLDKILGLAGEFHTHHDFVMTFIVLPQHRNRSRIWCVPSLVCM